MRLPRHKRIMAGIMGILMLLIILFSAFYIAAEADHDCTGEDCPICACIHQCEKTLYQISDGIAVQTAVIIPFVFMLVIPVLFTVCIQHETLISKKIRLNS